MGIFGHEVTIVVDIANVMGSRPDGWWRDRAGAAVRLHDQIVQLAASGRAILPGDDAILPGDDQRPGENDQPRENAPAFVLVLEGAARAAVPRLAPAPPSAAEAPAAADAAAAAEAPAAADAAAAAEAPAAADATTATSASSDPAETGPPRPGEVRVVEARGSGDDTIVAVVRELPGRRVVVTADRELRARCAAAGAEILGPGWLLGLLPPSRSPRGPRG